MVAKLLMVDAASIFAGVAQADEVREAVMETDLLGLEQCMALPEQAFGALGRALVRPERR